MRACDIKLMLDSGDQRFRFVGRLKLSSIRKFSHIKERIFEGIVVSLHHCLITDGKGVLFSVDNEFEKLFHIRE